MSVLLNEAMRDYIDVIATQDGSCNGPELNIDDHASQVDQGPTTTPSQEEIHGITFTPEPEIQPSTPRPRMTMDTSSSGGIADKMRELSSALQAVLGDVNRGSLEEQSTPEESPEEMAPDIDSQGHQSYKNPEGDSYAERQGFTG